MRTLCAVVIAVAILVVSVGIYRGWFGISHPVPNEVSHVVNVNFTADPDKMKQDVRAIEDKATELTGGVMDDVKADGQVQRQSDVK